MDVRIAQARDNHRLSKEKEEEAARFRMQRDDIVRRLRNEDPKYWTLGRLAHDIGCSRELIHHIIKTALRDGESGGLHGEVHGSHPGHGG